MRARIGLAAQAATVDGLLTAREQPRAGRPPLPPAAAPPRGARADELLERLGLADDADRLVKTFSGGMRRRLDLAATLVAAPPVLFLDEPTTGLDPQSRNELWELLRELVRDGTTLLLTTQYLEEADRLADDIVVLDHGRVVASGSPGRAQGAHRRRADRRHGRRARATCSPARRALAPFADGRRRATATSSVVTVPVAAGTPLLDVVRALDAAGVAATDVHRREATLDDVFLTLTAHAASEEVAA